MNTEIQTDIQMESIHIESTEPGALAELSDSDLDQVSGGCGGMGDLSSFFGSSTSSFSQRSLNFGQMTFAGPNGAGSAKFFSLDETSSFAQELLGGSQ